jgi:hypothetical protein
MQQYCNTCGAPITAGMAACARCGTPVSSGGSYDPTVRAGSPPSSGYGQQPYGPPSSDPYGAPPPPPPGFGGPPGYGAPQSQPGYGAPPPPPGFGGPPPGYGGPQQPFMAPPPQKKSRAWLYVVGSIVVILIILCVGGIFALRALGNAATTLPTSGEHISNVQIGKGDNEGNITDATKDFSVSDDIVINFTATADAGAVMTLKLVKGSQSQVLDPPLDLDSGQHDYYYIFAVNAPGSYTAEIQYNDTTEAAVAFTVA